jgi:hypothetical protein
MRSIALHLRSKTGRVDSPAILRDAVRESALYLYFLAFPPYSTQPSGLFASDLPPRLRLSAVPATQSFRFRPPCGLLRSCRARREEQGGWSVRAREFHRGNFRAGRRGGTEAAQAQPPRGDIVRSQSLGKEFKSTRQPRRPPSKLQRGERNPEAEFSACHPREGPTCRLTTGRSPAASPWAALLA